MVHLCVGFQKSWDIALAPVKQVPMNLFIMWMAGNSISIFPIMMVGMMFIRPIQALMAVQQSRLHHLHLPHHDGRHDVHPTYPGSHGRPTE